MSRKQPIIIVGMHRSGTTLISKILQDLGVFMGNAREKNQESKYFLKLNDWLLHQTYSSWDSPENFMLIDQDDINYFVNLCKISQKNIFSNIRYFGFWKYLFQYKFTRPPKLWGWKDPRNSLTFPIWNAIYPNAKIIHIYRNPVDVAESLRRRESAKKKELIKSKPNWLKIILNKGRLGNVSFRFQHLEPTYKVWEKYVSNCYEINKNVLHIKYEDFLSDPSKWIKLIIGFLELIVSDDQFIGVINQMNPSRKYAFVSNPELVSFYNSIKNKEWMKKLGYDRIKVV